MCKTKLSMYLTKARVVSAALAMGAVLSLSGPAQAEPPYDNCPKGQGLFGGNQLHCPPGIVPPLVGNPDDDYSGYCWVEYVPPHCVDLPDDPYPSDNPPGGTPPSGGTLAGPGTLTAGMDGGTLTCDENHRRSANPYTCIGIGANPLYVCECDAMGNCETCDE